MVPRDRESEHSDLCLHPLHLLANDDTPSPLQLAMLPEKATKIQALVDLATAALHTYSATFACHMGRYRKEHGVFLGGPGLIVSASSKSADVILHIPLKFSEVARFQVGGATFLAIGLREGNEQQIIGDVCGPFSQLWVIGVSERPTVSIFKLLTIMGSLGAIRSDLHVAYDVTEKSIGSGGCSSVFLGHPRAAWRSGSVGDTADYLSGAVAVKILTGSEPLRMAVAEADFLAGATRHPNIIHYQGLFKYDPCSDGSLHWAILMEYCPSGDLNDHVSAKGPCSELRAAEIMLGVLSALTHLHACGIVHRDVKSENILLDQTRPVLTDFGIAARVDDAEAMTKRSGSPGHCAPEILTRKKYGTKVDVFSTGVVLYFILSGRLPFWGPDIASVIRRTIRCRVKLDMECFSQVTCKMKGFILQWIEKEDEQRPEASLALQQMQATYCAHFEVRASYCAILEAPAAQAIMPSLPSCVIQDTSCPSLKMDSGSPSHKNGSRAAATEAICSRSERESLSSRHTGEKSLRSSRVSTAAPTADERSTFDRITFDRSAFQTDDSSYDCYDEPCLTSDSHFVARLDDVGKQWAVVRERLPCERLGESPQPEEGERPVQSNQVPSSRSSLAQREHQSAERSPSGSKSSAEEAAGTHSTPTPANGPRRAPSGVTFARSWRRFVAHGQAANGTHPVHRINVPFFKRGHADDKYMQPLVPTAMGAQAAVSSTHEVEDDLNSGRCTGESRHSDASDSTACESRWPSFKSALPRRSNEKTAKNWSDSHSAKDTDGDSRVSIGRQDDILEEMSLSCKTEDHSRKLKLLRGPFSRAMRGLWHRGDVSAGNQNGGTYHNSGAGAASSQGETSDAGVGKA